MNITGNLNNPAERKKIRDALSEISISYTRIEAERDLIKTIVANLSEQHELPKKTVNKMARVFHKQNFSKEQQEFSEFEHVYQAVTSS